MVWIAIATACSPRGNAAARDSSMGTSSVGGALPTPSDAPPPSDSAVASPPPGTVEFYPAATLSHVADALARGTTTAHSVSRHQSFIPIVARRAASGVPEVHDEWIDVTWVQSGRAAILTGGRVTGSHVESPGEHRGGSIAGGTEHPLAPGDLFVIPAGTPHQFMVPKGDSIRYVTIKVRDHVPR